MRLLFEYSEEVEKMFRIEHFKGTIRQLPRNMDLKVPHMGWNLLKTKVTHYLAICQAPYVYFVHSYYLDTPIKILLLEIAVTELLSLLLFKGERICHQFHPERAEK